MRVALKVIHTSKSGISITKAQNQKTPSTYITALLVLYYTGVYGVTVFISIYLIGSCASGLTWGPTSSARLLLIRVH